MDIRFITTIVIGCLVISPAFAGKLVFVTFVSEQVF